MSEDATGTLELGNKRYLKQLESSSAFETLYGGLPCELILVLASLPASRRRLPDLSHHPQAEGGSVSDWGQGKHDAAYRSSTVADVDVDVEAQKVLPAETRLSCAADHVIYVQVLQ